MKLMFMLCNSCMRMINQSKNWLVDHKNCTCIFLEESVETMKVIRRTYWSNGLVTDREMFTDEDTHQEFIDEQRRRFTNGPGIDSVKLFDYRNRCYMVFAHKAGGNNVI